MAIVTMSESMSTGKNADSMADSSITSYSSVVIHHPQGKKSSKESEEGRSRAYFKVKRLKTQSDEPPVQGDFRPSQYFPESDSEKMYKTMDSNQYSQKPREAEYRDEKSSEEDQDTRKTQQKEDRSSEESNWRQNFRPGVRHQSRKQHADDNSLEQDSRKSMKQSAEVSKESVENGRSSERLQNEEAPKLRPKQEDKMVIQAEIQPRFRYEFPNAIPAVPIDLTHPFETIHIQPKMQPIPPPGMSAELIQTLLSQQPQTFDSEQNFESKKKSKSQNYRVGYSIGFGGDEIVLGKPKDVRLHINGKNSIWKTLTNGVEMSEDVDKNKPMALKVQDSREKAGDSLLKNDVYYMNNYKLDTSVPTTGRNTFNHAQALTNSNTFDFSNAVDPVWVQQQPVELDMSALYQSLGYSSAVPVYIPDPKGSGAMVQAIVIPVPALQGVALSADGQSLQQQPMPLQSALHQPILQPASHQSLQLQQNTHETLQIHPSSHQALQMQPGAHQQPLQMQPSAHHQPLQIQSNTHYPFHLRSNSHQSAQNQAAPHSIQLHAEVQQPLQLHPELQQSLQLQSPVNSPYHLVPLQFAHVIQMNEPQHQSSIPAVPMPVQLKAHVQQLQPVMQHLQSNRVAKARDSIKQSSFENTPIVVSAGPSDQAKLQQELNAILADEMKRKNLRHPAGIRHPMPF